jgi:hypothetical protein
VSAGTAPPSEQAESPFEHPALEHLYLVVLHDVADRRLDLSTRKAAARALAFLLRERVLDERTATDVLTAVHRSLDLAAGVRTLLLGLRDALGDHERITEWATAVADRAVREGQRLSFMFAMRLLVELRDYDGTVPTRWRLAILRAAEVPYLAPQVRLFCKAYAQRFTQSSPWLQKARVVSTATFVRRRVKAEGMREARDS